MNYKPDLIVPCIKIIILLYQGFENETYFNSAKNRLPPCSSLQNSLNCTFENIYSVS